MPRYRLKRDVSVMFNGGGDPAHGYEVKAKAGTVVKMIPDGMGKPCFAVPPHACDAGAMGAAGTWSIFGHDSKHYHVWVSADDVEEFEAGQ